MAILISAHELTKAFGARPLFEGLTFSVESGERIGLIGPNGAGKSTLLRILAGQAAPDRGTLSLQRGLRVGFLEQVPSFSEGATALSAALEGARDPDDWQSVALAQETLSKLSLDPEAKVARLSGGWKKRVALARELVKGPDLLLLDEPTNHLDVESILWLEELLARSPFATITITHDRAFLQRIANRILELDRRNPGGLLSVRGEYADYLEAKQEQIANQAQQETRLRNTLRRETEWLRRGAKARTTKQQARIQRAEELGERVGELAYRNRESRVDIDFQAAEKSPKKLVEARGISKAYGGEAVIPPLDLLITPKSRIGLLGPNGCGKSTLIRLLLGEEKPDSGTVTHSEHLKAAYFEQNRESLDPSVSLLRTVCPVGEYVDYRGSRVHVKSYLGKFLFEHAQMEMAVGKLSGGEQSRILIAKLMLREANVLVLDEPTNDLDLATLDVLAEVLADFPGAVLLVTHDRFFLDQVATRILAFGRDERGRKEIVAFEGLSQWEDWHARQTARGGGGKADAPAEPGPAPASGAAPSPAKKGRLSYKDQRELDHMEENIQKAEARLAELTAESQKPELASNAARLTELTHAMAEAQAEIDRLYARWQELTG